MPWKQPPAPLVSKTARLKNPVMDFFCPLCRTKREFKYGSKLNRKHYIQIFSLGLFLFLVSQPLMQERAFFWFFLVWGGFEFVRKLLYRKEIPCPHCGFDATWYKRDVKVAKRIVEDFWKIREDSTEGPVDEELLDVPSLQTQENTENTNLGSF